MFNLNKVLLTGNVTKTPELRYTPTGIKISNIRLAINREYKNKTGEIKKDVTFITVVVWEELAETCVKYLITGRTIFVEGSLQSHSWEADGKKQSIIEVRAERIRFLDHKSVEATYMEQQNLFRSAQYQPEPITDGEVQNVKSVVEIANESLKNENPENSVN